jgi:hypothetical protein
MERTECSEMSAHEIQTPGNYPEESTQHSEHGESLKSRNQMLINKYNRKKITNSMFYQLWLSASDLICLIRD